MPSGPLVVSGIAAMPGAIGTESCALRLNGERLRWRFLATLDRLREVALLDPEAHPDGEQHAEDGGVGQGLADVELDAPDEVDGGQDARHVDQLMEPHPAV